MKKSRFFALLLCLALLLSPVSPVLAVEETELRSCLDVTAAYQLKNLQPVHGNEWTILGLVRGGYELPEGFAEAYRADTADYVAENRGEFRKSTEYARLSLTLTALGYDSRDVGGYDLTEALMDFDRMTAIGMNGAIWALLGLDCGDYRSEEAEAAAVRQRYVDLLLGRQLRNGGFSLTGRGGASTPADTDITAMTLQALSGYLDQEAVAEAVERAVACLSEIQQEDGGFRTMNIATSESAAQVIVALGELGIAWDDPRFVKNGRSVLDALLDYRQEDGSFLHVLDGDNGIAGISCDQGFYAMVAALRCREGKSGLFHMSDTEKITGTDSAGAGLPGKDPAVHALPVSKPGVSFGDVTGTPYQAAVEALASREIINGMSDTAFEPEATMTRAQYAAIVVRALGLTPEYADVFPDVPAGKWYSDYVGTAFRYGLVGGRDDGNFWPGDTITRQEAAVLTARAAVLCGMDTELDDNGIRMYIAQFTDYVQVGRWARGGVAFCFREGILLDTEFGENIEPQTPILRGEIARMVHRLLQKAKLL